MILSHSGGLDSSTLFKRALFEGYTVLPINYIYGQANYIEKVAQEKIHSELKKEYSDQQVLDSITIDFTQSIGDSIKTFQKNRDNGKTEKDLDMKYYMPSRNLLFLSTAAVIGEIVAIDQEIKEIYLGIGIHKHSDIYSKDYWDISVDFANRLENLLQLNDNVNVHIYAPYKTEHKSEIIHDALKLGLDYNLTWTCYEPIITEKDNNKIFKPCGECEACRERYINGQEAGMDDINNYEYIIPIENNDE